MTEQVIPNKYTINITTGNPATPIPSICEFKEKTRCNKNTQIKNLGVNFKSQGECAVAAQKENECKGDSIEWSEPYNMLWGCSCCE